MTGYDACSDEELLERMRMGENGISDYLMEKYKSLVRKKARTLYLMGGERDDLIQEGMIGLFRAVMDFQPDKGASFMTFAGLCIDRQLYNAVQSSQRQKNLPLNSYVSFSDEDENRLEQLWVENPESIVIEREDVRAFKEEISKILSPMEKKVLDAYLRGDSYEEIAGMLGKSQKSVDNALARVRGKIRRYIDGRKNLKMGGDFS